MGVATKLFPGFDDPLAQPNLLLRVGEHVLDVGTLRLTTRPDYPRLTSKAVAVLLQLVRDRGNTVTREQLLDRVWTDRITTPDVLTQAIKELRRAFADDAKPSRYIETIPKVGYRLLADVAILGHDDAALAERQLPQQAINDPYLDTRVAPPALTNLVPQPSAVATRRWPWLALAAVAFGVAILYFAGTATSPAAVHGEWRVSDLRSLSSDPGAEDRPHISPDGTRVAYSKADPQSHLERILLRAVGATRSLPWASEAKANEDTPLWSPDGQSIVFERVSDTSCELVVTSNLGGETRVVGNCQSPLTNYYDWTPDGSKLITAERSKRSNGHLALIQWDLSSGEKQALDYARPPEADDLNAHYSPDGKLLAFRRGLAPYSDLWLMNADGRDAHQLTHLRASIRGYTWSRDSAALILSSDHEGHFGLYAVDVRSGAIQSLHVNPAEFPDAARHDDTVVYEIPRVQYKMAERDIGESETVRSLAPSTGSEIQPTYSPAGNRIAFVSDRSGAQQLWLYDNASGATTVLTDFRDALLSNPSWSADGSRLLITVRKPVMAQLFEIELASRRHRLLSKSGDDVQAASYGAYPDSVLLTLGVPGKDNQVLLVEHAGTAREHRRVLESGLWHSEFDIATRRLYYSRNAHHGVFARTLSSDGELSAEKSIAPDVMDGWHVIDGRVWHFAPSRLVSKSTDLLEFNPQDGSERVLAHIDAEPRDALFSVAPQHDRILYTTAVSEDTDIGALRLTYASAH